MDVKQRFNNNNNLYCIFWQILTSILPHGPYLIYAVIVQGVAMPKCWGMYFILFWCVWKMKKPKIDSNEICCHRNRVCVCVCVCVCKHVHMCVFYTHTCAHACTHTHKQWMKLIDIMWLFCFEFTFLKFQRHCVHSSSMRHILCVS